MKSKKVLLFLSTICGLSLVSLITASIAWFVGIPTIESNIDSDIKNIAGYFDSKTGEGNGEGTSENPFIITKPVHFHNLMRLQNESKVYPVLTSSVYFQIGKEVNGNHYVYSCTDSGTLSSELDSSVLNMKMYEGNFDSIGTETRPFKSNLISYTDITISKLTVNSHNGYGGLFGYITDGTATNIVLNNFTVDVDENNAYVGFLAGYTSNTNKFTGCKVNGGTFNKPNTSYTMSSKFGYFGKAGNISDEQYSAKGTSTKLGLNASDITNETTNTFSDWQYDHNDTRENYTKAHGDIDYENNFSTSIDGDGYVANGNVLSNYGHVKSENSRLYYNNGSEIEEISKDAANNGTTAPTISSNPGEYFYKGSSNYKYSEVEGQGSNEGVYNVFTISTKSESGVTAYLKYDGTTNPASLKAVTTTPGAYAETPDYYFALLKSTGSDAEAKFGYQSLRANQSYEVYLYSPANGKHLVKDGSNDYRFYYNSGVNDKTPQSFAIPSKDGIVKSLPGLYVSFNGSTPSISTVKGTYNTYYSFTSSGTGSIIWNKPKQANEGPSIAAAGDKYKKVTTAPSSWDGEYLLVYEQSTTSGCVWTGVDAANCYESHSITSSTITAVNTTVSLTIDEIETSPGKYSIQINGGTNNGKYIGRTSNSNGFEIGTTVYENSLSIGDGAVITSSAGPTMRWNNNSDQQRFRYYKSGQKAIQLYKKENTKALSSITLSGNQKTEFIYDDTFTYSGLVVTAHYSDGSTATVTPASVTGYNSKTIGSQTITVSYTEGGVTKNATYTVTVYDGISAISLSGSYKTKYNVGEDFTSAGITVTGTVNGSSETLDSDEYSIDSSQVRKNAAGTYTVTVTYSGTAYRYTGSAPSKTYQVTYYSLPNPTIGPSSVSLEVGKTASLTLSGTDISTAQWSVIDNSACLSIISSTTSTSGVTISAISYNPSATTATVQVVCSNGAGGQTTVTKVVTITPKLVQSISTTLDTPTMTLTDDPINIYNTITFNPSDAYDKSVTYSLATGSDPCVSIDQSTGLMTPIAEGIAEVIITSNSNPSATCSFTVEVLSTAKNPILTPDSGNIYEMKYDEDNLPIFNAQCIDTTSVQETISGPGNPDINPTYDALTGEYSAEIFAYEDGVYTVTFTPYYNEIPGETVTRQYKLYRLASLNINSSSAKTTFEINEQFTYAGLVVDAVYKCGNEDYRTDSSITPNSVTIPSNLGTGTTFTGAGNGNVTVSYTDNEGSQISGTYSITVYKKITNVTLSTTIGSDGYTYNLSDGATIKMLIGETKLIKANITPTDATNPRYDWSSNITAVATVTNPTYHTTTITARSVGTTTITLKVKANLQSEQIVRTVNIEVVESLAASQTPIIPSIPFTGENKVSNYDLLVNFDNDANYEVFNPYDTAPTFYKDSQGYWCVCAMKGQKVDEKTDFTFVTDASQIEDGDRIIILGTHYCPSKTTPAVVDQENYDGPNRAMSEVIEKWSGNPSTCKSRIKAGDQYSTSDCPTTISNQTVESNSDTTIFTVDKIGDEFEFKTEDNSYLCSYYKDQDSKNGLYYSSSSSSQTKWSIEYSLADNDTSGNRIGLARISGYYTSTQNRSIAYNCDSLMENGNFYFLDLSSNQSKTLLPRIYKQKVTQTDTIQHDFVVDNVSHTDSSGTPYNPFTKTGARFDIVGGTTGTNAQAMQLTKNSINITTTSSKSYSAALSSGKFDPNRLANTILTYIPKTGAYDLGTIKLTTAGSKDYGFVRSTGGVPLSSSNYVNSTDLSSLGADTYISFNTGNINKIAYCGLDASGNYCSLDSASLQTYVIAITARQGKTINIASIEYEFNSSVCNNIHIDNIPFIFAFSSSGITSLDMTYSSTYNRYNFTITSSSNYYIDFINHNVLKQSGDSTNPCYLKCNGSVITSGVQRYYNT